MSSVIYIFILARFQMKNGFPTLMLIRAGGNDTTTYLGPTDLESLVEFVNEATPKEPPPSLKFKVNKKLNILDQEEYSNIGVHFNISFSFINTTIDFIG